jgi:hypothetical protein
MVIATKTAIAAIVKSRFLFSANWGRIFSASKVGFRETDMGIPLLKIFFFIIQIYKLPVSMAAKLCAAFINPK